MRKNTRTLCALSVAGLCAGLAACGGGDSKSPTAPTVVVAAPTPCTQSTLLQGSGSLPGRTVDFETISVNTAGRVDLILDWTFAASPIGLFLVQGGCTLEQFNARSCNFLIRSESGSKPRKASASSVAPGSYSVLIANAATESESLSLQVFLSSSTCPSITSAATGSRATAAAVNAEVVGILGR